MTDPATPGERPMVARVPATHDAIAPDGSEVRLLTALDAASQAHFRLPPGGVSSAVVHLSVSECWYVVGGAGTIWLAPHGTDGAEHPLAPGVAVAIPAGTHFQFRAATDDDLQIVGVTVPPWPTDRVEAVPVANHWPTSA